ncbi:cholinesterase [Leucosporidium creatinivorum]|uniref:Carboxylic ester hydrolase n=1 Tax=Leucosporidium creatinivorum TaxID=106004 RepID=A0A1Y2DGC9_9BASI|nr:cholinesterase [Leucosporidium creatinivorum]
MLALALFASSLATLASASPLRTRAGPSVTSDGSTYVGVSSNGIDSFKGIPFAQPPVGNLRFAPPVALTSSLGTVDASNYGYSCPQMNLANGVSQTGSGKILLTLFLYSAAEDCLTINVQRPAGVSATAKLPVMYWIFGGAFLLGGTTMYDGSALVARSVALGQPIVFVSVNYRLNSFGFLPGKEVAADSSASVNAGLLDQRLGLEWVQKNIANFGGDPDKVTIFGESAGAISIAFHLIAKDGDITSSTTGRPLFRAAIMESGAPIPVEGAARGQKSYDIIAKATGCYGSSAPIACLRAVPYAKLLAATNLLPNIASYNSVSLPFLPRTDGIFLRSMTQNAMPAGKFAKVPIISGNQYDEGTILALGTLNITTEAQLNTWLQTVWFPNTTAAQRTQILKNYPADVTQGSPFDTGLLNVITPQNKRINAIVGDVVFQVCRRFFLEYTYPAMPSWSYVSRALVALPLVGSFHGSDILNVFGLSPLNPTTEMQTRWIAFANTMNRESRFFLSPRRMAG